MFRCCGAASDRACKHCKLARICTQCGPSGQCAEACMAPQRSKLPVSSTSPSVLLCQASLVAAQVAAGTFKPAKQTNEGNKGKAKPLEPCIRIPCTQESRKRHISPLLEKLPASSPLKAAKYHLAHSDVPAAISTLASHVAQPARGAAYHRLQLHFMV